MISAAGESPLAIDAVCVCGGTVNSDAAKKPRGGAAWVVAGRIGKVSRTVFAADRSRQSG